MIERSTISTPDGGTIYLDKGYHDAPPSRPYHLVGCGMWFESPEAAQAYVNEHWNDPAPEHGEDTRYARMEASFGELP